LIGIDSGILPFSKRLAEESVKTCWRRVIESEQATRVSIDQAMSSLRCALADDARTPLLRRGQSLPSNAYAFRRQFQGATLAFLTEAAIGAVCEVESWAVEPILAELKRLGALAPGHGRNRKQDVATGGGKRGQFFAVKGAFWKAPGTV